MESHGIFGKSRPYNNRGGRGQGRRVNFQDEHDDRCRDEGGSSGNSSSGTRDYSGSRGRGPRVASRWLRNRGGRSRGGFSGRRDRLEGNSSHEGDGEGGGSRQRFKPYDKSPPGGGDRGKWTRGRSSRGSGGAGNSVFSRLGANRGGKGRGRGTGKGPGSVFSRLSDSGDSGTSSWHKILIPGMADQNHDEVFRELQSRIEEPFQPQKVHTGGDKLIFFIEESRAANQLKQLNGVDNITIYVKPSPPPHGMGGNRDFGESSRGGFKGLKGSDYQRMDSDTMEVQRADTQSVLLQVLGERYDTMSMSLDLSNMFHDKAFQDNKIHASMYDHGFVSTVLDLIANLCPNLCALHLSHNKIRNLSAYGQLKDKCPQLQILDLSDNQIQKVQDLEVLGCIASVTTLVLENNPLQEHMSNFATYASAVRKYFPNVQLLDGQQLPGPVKFDLPSSTGSLPPVEKGYLVNDEVKNLVVSFLEQYYTLYDGESRDKLLEAYGDSAVFSMSIIAQQQQQQQRGPGFQHYLQQSRNLIKVTDPVRRGSLLKQGRIDIVQCLRGFPKTHHVASTFNVDVMKASPMSTIFTVYGIFGEAPSNPRSDLCPLRSFSRTFALVAAGTGVAIVNDQLTIRNATAQNMQDHLAEVQQHFQSQQPSLLTGPSQLATGPSQLTTGPSLVATGGLQQQPFVPQATSFATNPQDEAIRRLSIETSMNVEWSKKCLEENNWNYDNALKAFKLIRSQNKIPPEAFHTIM